MAYVSTLSRATHPFQLRTVNGRGELAKTCEYEAADLR